MRYSYEADQNSPGTAVMSALQRNEAKLCESV